MSTNDEGKIRNNCGVDRYIPWDVLINCLGVYFLTCTFTVSFHPVSCMWCVGFAQRTFFILHTQDGESQQKHMLLLI